LRSDGGRRPWIDPRAADLSPVVQQDERWDFAVAHYPVHGDLACICLLKLSDLRLERLAVGTIGPVVELQYQACRSSR
jgi:hypothetical protein